MYLCREVLGLATVRPRRHRGGSPRLESLMFRHMSALIAVLLSLACGGSGDATEPRARVSRISITPLQVTIDGVGRTAQFSAQALDSQGQIVPTVSVTWTSGNTAIAEVQSGT